MKLRKPTVTASRTEPLQRRMVNSNTVIVTPKSIRSTKLQGQRIDFTIIDDVPSITEATVGPYEVSGLRNALAALEKRMATETKTPNNDERIDTLKARAERLTYARTIMTDHIPRVLGPQGRWTVVEGHRKVEDVDEWQTIAFVWIYDADPLYKRTYGEDTKHVQETGVTRFDYGQVPQGAKGFEATAAAKVVEAFESRTIITSEDGITSIQRAQEGSDREALLILLDAIEAASAKLIGHCTGTIVSTFHTPKGVQYEDNPRGIEHGGSDRLGRRSYEEVRMLQRNRLVHDEATEDQPAMTRLLPPMSVNGEVIIGRTSGGAEATIPREHARGDTVPGDIPARMILPPLPRDYSDGRERPDFEWPADDDARWDLDRLMPRDDEP